MEDGAQRLDGAWIGESAHSPVGGKLLNLFGPLLVAIVPPVSARGRAQRTAVLPHPVRYADVRAPCSSPASDGGGVVSRSSIAARFHQVRCSGVVHPHLAKRMLRYHANCEQSGSQEIIEWFRFYP